MSILAWIVVGLIAGWAAGVTVRGAGFGILGDIVVGRNATLVLDSSILLLWADNVLGYTNSRIVQRSSYMLVDVSERMRGGLLDFVHIISSGVLKVDWAKLAAQPATKL